ncbi:antitoxin [Kutzneria buriramensis]|uniref:Antitoxin protein of toxin-antitoxin system n=1 Tax=Kutzneria buriramensis TaxID=1045776 RepID=A0A3E0HKU2_9PSEU|nr:antitoxin [Kutzneria buriramensis]REH47113.1 antitoxin protein of toxin-antitoxin system [Kutzneria buriramensis]
MALSDKLNELKNKAKEMVGEHGDKADGAVDRAGEFVDEKTGNKHSDQIRQGTDKAKEGLRNWGGGDQQQQ